LEGDENEKVAKTNVWVMIKRNGKCLQGFEDNFKKIEEGKWLVKQQGL